MTMKRTVQFIALIAILVFLAGFTIARAAEKEKTPSSVVREFYQWYFKNQEHYRDKISQQKNNFEPELYENLADALKKGPPDKNWLDFEPFVNAQWSAKSYKITKENVQGNKALVDVNIQLGRGKSALQVLLKKSQAGWKIANFIYNKDFNLADILKK